MKPDIIVTWPRNCDYPLWREYIHQNRDRFNLVIIIFMETHAGYDYRPFIKEAVGFDYILCGDSPKPASGDDWRNIAVRHGLIVSYNAPWVWFTEQDFLPQPGFWEKVDELEKSGTRIIGIRDGQRLHPCSLFIRRDCLDSLVRDFSAKAPEYDHFGFIQKQLEKTNEPVAILDPSLYTHMNGLSHNLRLMTDGVGVTYKPDEFNTYLKASLQARVTLHPSYIATVTEYINNL